MISNTEKNKYLAERMGLCWHEWSENGYCIKPCCGNTDGTRLAHKSVHPQPDYFTAEGRQGLLEWCCKSENSGWWSEFLRDHSGRGDFYWLSVIPQDLLIPESALADAVYEYLKGRDDE